MPKKRTLTPSASPLHHFGSELRRAREEAGMTLAEFGALVPCDNSTVSRIEAGLIAPDLHLAEVADRAFTFARGWFTRFFNDSQEWNGNNALAPAFRDFADDEAEATALFVFEAMVLPGLLQTEDYARALLSRHPGVTPAQVDARVTARLDRQSVLDRDDPPFLWVLLDEMVLHRDIGGAKVMHDALLHVAEMSERPRISVQVLAVSAHVGVQGSFNVAETTGARNTAYLDDASDGRLSEDAATVATLVTRFRHLQTEALTATASRNMIVEVAEEKWVP